MEYFQFRLDGPVFQNGVPLYLALDALDNFQSIVDKTYLVATGGKKMSARDRDVYQIRASAFRQGSFITDFQIALYGVQLALPFISDLGLRNLWEYTKETFNFLKLVFATKDSGMKPKIEISKSQNVTVHVGDIHHHFHGTVIQIAEQSLPKYQELAHLLDQGKIERISAGTPEKYEMQLELKDKTLFDVPTNIKEHPIQIACEIFDFNKFKNIGKLRIGEDQVVPAGDYNFSIFGTQDNVNYIYSMLKPVVTIRCLVEMAMVPFGPDKIVHLHVTEVERSET